VACVAVLVLAVRVSANPASDAAAADAKTKAKANDFVGAAAKFREAYAADPSPDLMCNVGVAYFKAKDLPRAERYLDQCEAVGKSLEPTFLAKIATVHQAVITKLGAGDFTPVDLSVEPATASVAIEGGVPFDEPVVGSRRVWFPAGKHYKLTVHAEGYVDQTAELDAKGKAPSAQRIALERAPVVEVGSDAGSGSGSEIGSGSGSGLDGSAGTGSAGSAASIEPPPLHVLSHRSRTAAVTATVATGVVGATSVVMWLIARSRADHAGTRLDPTLHDDDAASAQNFQHASWITAGVAGVGAIVSGYLWYRTLAGPTVSVEVAPSSGAVVTLGGAW
jgi:hypothetical protein